MNAIEKIFDDAWMELADGQDIPYKIHDIPPKNACYVSSDCLQNKSYPQYDESFNYRIPNKKCINNGNNGNINNGNNGNINNGNNGYINNGNNGYINNGNNGNINNGNNGNINNGNNSNINNGNNGNINNGNNDPYKNACCYMQQDIRAIKEENIPTCKFECTNINKNFEKTCANSNNNGSNNNNDKKIIKKSKFLKQKKDYESNKKCINKDVILYISLGIIAIITLDIFIHMKRDK